MKHKIFGIGLSRTGGTSLSVALQELGYKTVHHPWWMVRRDLSLKYDLVEKYDALLDSPFVVHYKELARKYPKAKFILTVRDVDSWLESNRRLHNHVRPFIAFLPHVLALDKKIWGQLRFEPENMKKKYQAYVAGVKRFFKDEPERLLILNIVAGEGYEKLCPFLGKKILKKSFPRKNRGYKTILDELFFK